MTHLGAPPLVGDSGSLPLPSIRSTRRHLTTHVVAPVAVAIVLVWWLEVLAGNRWIADHIYSWEGGQWLFREHVVTSSWIHPGGKYLSLTLWVVALSFWLHSRRFASLSKRRSALAYLLVATVLATGLVSVLKASIAMDCPWDMRPYGGLRPYLGLFDLRSSEFVESSHCFPAGHAGAGYSWMALYFFCLRIAPRWRFEGLLVGLILGLTFGISQQLRGAHFLSHDVVSALACWLTVLTLHRFMRPGRSGHGE